MRGLAPAMRGNTALAHAYEYEVEPEPELIDNVIPIGQRRTLLELTEETCRWPIGDPGSADFFFCGGQTATGLPYCAYHSRVAYQPAQCTAGGTSAVPRLRCLSRITESIVVGRWVTRLCPSPPTVRQWPWAIDARSTRFIHSPRYAPLAFPLPPGIAYCAENLNFL